MSNPKSLAEVKKGDVVWWEGGYAGIGRKAAGSWAEVLSAGPKYIVVKKPCSREAKFTRDGRHVGSYGVGDSIFTRYERERQLAAEQISALRNRVFKKLLEVSPEQLVQVCGVLGLEDEPVGGLE